MQNITQCQVYSMTLNCDIVRILFDRKADSGQREKAPRKGCYNAQSPNAKRCNLSLFYLIFRLSPGDKGTRLSLSDFAGLTPVSRTKFRQSSVIITVRAAGSKKNSLV